MIQAILILLERKNRKIHSLILKRECLEIILVKSKKKMKMKVSQKCLKMNSIKTRLILKNNKNYNMV